MSVKLMACLLTIFATNVYAGRCELNVSWGLTNEKSEVFPLDLHKGIYKYFRRYYKNFYFQLSTDFDGPDPSSAVDEGDVTGLTLLIINQDTTVGTSATFPADVDVAKIGLGTSDRTFENQTRANMKCTNLLLEK